jgi:hypothetical protein
VIGVFEDFGYNGCLFAYVRETVPFFGGVLWVWFRGWCSIDVVFGLVVMCVIVYRQAIVV